MDITEFEQRLYPHGQEFLKWKPADYRDLAKRVRALKIEIGSKRYRELNRELMAMGIGQTRVYGGLVLRGLAAYLPHRRPKNDE